MDAGQVAAVVELAHRWGWPEGPFETVEDDPLWLLLRLSQESPCLPAGDPWPLDLAGFLALDERAVPPPRTQEWLAAWALVRDGGGLWARPWAQNDPPEVVRRLFVQRQWALAALALALPGAPTLRAVLDGIDPHNLPSDSLADIIRINPERKLDSNFNWSWGQSLMHEEPMDTWKALLARDPGFKPTLEELKTVQPSLLAAFREWIPEHKDDRKALVQSFDHRCSHFRENYPKKDLELNDWAFGCLLLKETIHSDPHGDLRWVVSDTMLCSALRRPFEWHLPAFVDDPVALLLQPGDVDHATDLPLLGALLAYQLLPGRTGEPPGRAALWDSWLFPPPHAGSLPAPGRYRDHPGLLAGAMDLEAAKGVPFRGLVALAILGMPLKFSDYEELDAESRLFGLSTIEELARTCLKEAWVALEWLQTTLLAIGHHPAEVVDGLIDAWALALWVSERVYAIEGHEDTVHRAMNDLAGQQPGRFLLGKDPYSPVAQADDPTQTDTFHFGGAHHPLGAIFTYTQPWHGLPLREAPERLRGLLAMAGLHAHSPLCALRVAEALNDGALSCCVVQDVERWVTAQGDGQEGRMDPLQVAGVRAALLSHQLPAGKPFPARPRL